jgi:uncharacterized membrane protein YeiH
MIDIRQNNQGATYDMVYYLNLLGTAIFAVGGALAAARKGMDLLVL